MALRSQSPSDRNSTDGRVYSFSALPKAMLEDIVILTGAQAISEDLGPRSPSLSPTRAREALMIAGAGGAMRATGWRATAIRFQQLGEGATRWCRLLTTSPNSWPTAAARRRQNHPAAQSLLPWRTSVIRQCLNLTRPESGNPKKVVLLGTRYQSHWRATGPSRSGAMLTVAQRCSSKLIGFLSASRNFSHSPHLSSKRSISAQARRARRDERNFDDNSNDF